MVSIANSESLKKNERIVFLGDSITQGGARPGGYVDLIKKKLASDHSELGATIIGAGISGNKVPDLQRRLERDVLKKTYIGLYFTSTSTTCGNGTKQGNQEGCIRGRFKGYYQ